jgi:hypothetical protein
VALVSDLEISELDPPSNPLPASEDV